MYLCYCDVAGKLWGSILFQPFVHVSQVVISRYIFFKTTFGRVWANYLDLCVVSRLSIWFCHQLWEIIDLHARRWQIAILCDNRVQQLFNHVCFYIWVTLCQLSTCPIIIDTNVRFWKNFEIFQKVGSFQFTKHFGSFKPGNKWYGIIYWESFRIMQHFF